MIDEKKMAMMMATMMAARVPMENAIFPILVLVMLAITGMWVIVSSNPVITLIKNPRRMNLEPSWVDLILTVFYLRRGCLSSERGNDDECFGI